MKTISIIGLLLVLTFLSFKAHETTYFDYQKNNKIESIKEEDIIDEILESDKIKGNKKKSLKSEYADYIALIESSNVLDTINKFGYIGLYQFGSMALKDLKISKDKLLKMDKSKQRILFWKFARHNKRYLQNKMGLSFKNIKKKYGITSGALIYMMHRHGAGSTAIYLTTGIDHADGNGKKISEIPEKMRKYEFKF